MSEEIKISKEVLDMAGTIKAKFSVDSNTGAGTVGEDLYKESLPEDIDLKTIERVKAHDRTFIAATAHAFGELAIEAMKKNSKLENASIDIPMSKYDNVSHNIARHRTYQNHLVKGNEVIEKWGIMDTAYKAKGGRNIGDLKRVRVQLQQMAQKKLAK